MTLRDDWNLSMYGLESFLKKKGHKYTIEEISDIKKWEMPFAGTAQMVSYFDTTGRKIVDDYLKTRFIEIWAED
jgi:hypothetical protein